MRSTRSKKAAGQWRRTVEERAEVVGRYEESERTQRVFAREEGIGVSTLQLWLRQARGDEAGARPSASEARNGSGRAESISLLEVKLEGARSAANGRDAAGYEVELGGGTRLRLGTGFVEEEVRRLLALLKEVD
jgi:transposase-like protein